MSTKFIIKDPRWEDRNWPVREDGLKTLMGIDPKKKWPRDGMPVQVIQGIEVYVTPFVPRSRFHLRARAICPGCKADFAAGRIAQHVCKG